MPVVQNRLEGGLAVRVEGLAGGQILPQVGGRRPKLSASAPQSRLALWRDLAV